MRYVAVTYLRNRMCFFDGVRVTTEYVVNKEKRTIVCRITAIDDIPVKLAKYGLADDSYDEYDSDIRVYTGIAKCAPDDEWDELYGKRLAEYRASRARQVDVNNELKNYIIGVNRCLDNLSEFGLMRNPHKPKR